MPSVVLQQVSSPFARENAARTLEKDVALRFITKYLDQSTIHSIELLAPEGLIRIWGAKAERHHQFVKMPPRNSFVLFRRGKHVYAHGVIAETTESEPLAESLWGRDDDGETWPLIFFLKRFRVLPVPKEATRFNEHLGRKRNDNWQGLTAVYVKDSSKLQEYFARELGDV